MKWWQTAVFYETYIRSFQDSNGDGIGDLKGVADRLGYLADLGIGALWITPFYPSPQIDFGYDVSDHENVDPQFGTLGDFDTLIAAAHGRGIRVIVDIVLNHTSDRHPWFLDSRSSRHSPLRDWYIWRDGSAGGGPPNNWESAFGGPAWTLDQRTGQWYYHFFYSQQPDLNWRNPAVEERMLATLKFWLDRGVDGFRLDAVNTLYEDPGLRDNPALPEPNVSLIGVRTQEFVQTRRLPEVHHALRRVRAFVDRHAPDAVLISEAYVDAVEELVCFYGAGDEMHLPFNFFLAQVPTLDAAAFKGAIEDVEYACGERWPSLVLSNHDIARACDRYAPDGASDAVGKLLAMLLLTLRGSPFIYYGEEIGMRTCDPQHVDEVRDPVGRTFWPRYKGRDGARRPMQWDSTAGADFTTGTPWLALGPDAHERHVAGQLACSSSVLQFYRRLLRLRRDSEALRHGGYVAVQSHSDVLAYLRVADRETALVAMNMSATERAAQLVLPEGQASHSWQAAFGSRCESGDAIDPRNLQLAGYEAVLLRASFQARDQCRQLECADVLSTACR